VRKVKISLLLLYLAANSAAVICYWAMPCYLILIFVLNLVNYADTLSIELRVVDTL
jgi:hypothetical protein